ncbi:transposase [Dictyobacter formicarum]|uniref:Transposase InsH N-terminal domain-containing protein n=1 Tax=Dictyobacter formicarum TaxID=2778368 RepID=A0ABQ3VN84_9CHLR|nr:transposase [Dictyobacter formicarum]GHO87129.1 hypothetical protein KSZ_51350 [Dictyobacter formicarum]
MMGFKERTFAPCVAVSLEELVSQDHFYRHLQQILDLSFVPDLVRRSYAPVGRASLDPVVFFKLQLVMFFEGIRSERLLMRLVADRLSVRWYLGYDFHEPLPDHSSLSRIRTRYGLDIFRRFFDAILEQCQRAKLIWGKELYIDATKVDANASVDSLTTRFAVEARQAFQNHLEELFQEEDDPRTSVPAPVPLDADQEPRPLHDSGWCPLITLPSMVSWELIAGTLFSHIIPEKPFTTAIILICLGAGIVLWTYYSIFRLFRRSRGDKYRV